MKHKLIKLISVILIAAFAWQNVVFAGGDSLRPVARADREPDLRTGDDILKEIDKKYKTFINYIYTDPDIKQLLASYEDGASIFEKKFSELNASQYPAQEINILRFKLVRELAERRKLSDEDARELLEKYKPANNYPLAYRILYYALLGSLCLGSGDSSIQSCGEGVSYLVKTGILIKEESNRLERLDLTEPMDDKRRNYALNVLEKIERGRIEWRNIGDCAIIHAISRLDARADPDYQKYEPEVRVRSQAVLENKQYLEPDLLDEFRRNIIRFSAKLKRADPEAYFRFTGFLERASAAEELRFIEETRENIAELRSKIDKIVRLTEAGGADSAKTMWVLANKYSDKLIELRKALNRYRMEGYETSKSIESISAVCAQYIEQLRGYLKYIAIRKDPLLAASDLRNDMFASIRNINNMLNRFEEVINYGLLPAYEKEFSTGVEGQAINYYVISNRSTGAFRKLLPHIQYLILSKIEPDGPQMREIRHFESRAKRASLLGKEGPGIKKCKEGPRSDHMMCMLSRRRGRITGSMLYDLGDNHIEILNIMILPEYANKNAGMEMMAELKNLAHNEDSEFCSVSDINGNDAEAMGFLRNNEFKINRIIRNQFGEGAHGYAMICRTPQYAHHEANFVVLPAPKPAEEQLKKKLEIDILSAVLRPRAAGDMVMAKILPGKDFTDLRLAQSSILRPLAVAEKSLADSPVIFEKQKKEFIGLLSRRIEELDELLAEMSLRTVNPVYYDESAQRNFRRWDELLALIIKYRDIFDHYLSEDWMPQDGRLVIDWYAGEFIKRLEPVSIEDAPLFQARLDSLGRAAERARRFAAVVTMSSILRPRAAVESRLREGATVKERLKAAMIAGGVGCPGGISIRELGRRSGVSRTTIDNILADKGGKLQARTINGIADALGIDPIVFIRSANRIGRIGEPSRDFMDKVNAILSDPAKVRSAASTGGDKIEVTRFLKAYMKSRSILLNRQPIEIDVLYRDFTVHIGCAFNEAKFFDVLIYLFGRTHFYGDSEDDIIKTTEVILSDIEYKLKPGRGGKDAPAREDDEAAAGIAIVPERAPYYVAQLIAERYKGRLSNSDWREVVAVLLQVLPTSEEDELRRRDKEQGKSDEIAVKQLTPYLQGNDIGVAREMVKEAHWEHEAIRKRIPIEACIARKVEEVIRRRPEFGQIRPIIRELIREYISIENLREKKGVRVEPDRELTCPPGQNFLYDVSAYFTGSNGLQPSLEKPTKLSERAKSIQDKYAPLNKKLKLGGIFITIRHEQDVEKYLYPVETDSIGFCTVTEYREPTDRRFIVTVLCKVGLPRRTETDLLAAGSGGDEEGQEGPSDTDLEDLSRSSKVQEELLSGVLRPLAAGEGKSRPDTLVPFGDLNCKVSPNPTFKVSPYNMKSKWGQVKGSKRGQVPIGNGNRYKHVLRPRAAADREGLIKRGGDFRRTRQIWTGEAPLEESINYFRELRDCCERALRGEGAAGLPTYGYISDIHGDWDVWERCMREMEEKGVDVIVVGGDIIDRGTDGPRILEDIIRRSSAGQRIVYVLGSHETFLIRSMEGNALAFVNWIGEGGVSTLKGAYIPEGTVDIIATYCRKAKENDSKYKDILARIKEGGFVDPQELQNLLAEGHADAEIIVAFMKELVISNSRLRKIHQWLKENALLYFIDAYGNLSFHNKTPVDEEGMPALGLREAKGFAALNKAEKVISWGLKGDEIKPELDFLSACLFDNGFDDKFKSAGDMQENLLGHFDVSRIIYGHKKRQKFDKPADTRLIGVHTGGRAWLMVGPQGIRFIEEGRDIEKGALAGEEFLTQVKEYCEARLKKLEQAAELNGIPRREITSIFYPFCGVDTQLISRLLAEFPNVKDVYLLDDGSRHNFSSIVESFNQLQNTNTGRISFHFYQGDFFNPLNTFKFGITADLIIVKNPPPRASLQSRKFYKCLYDIYARRGAYIFITHAVTPDFKYWSGGFEIISQSVADTAQGLSSKILTPAEHMVCRVIKSTNGRAFERELGSSVLRPRAMAERDR